MKKTFEKGIIVSPASRPGESYVLKMSFGEHSPMTVSAANLSELYHLTFGLIARYKKMAKPHLKHLTF